MNKPLVSVIVPVYNGQNILFNVLIVFLRKPIQILRSSLLMILRPIIPMILSLITFIDIQISSI